jgi:hypothetical protein
VQRVINRSLIFESMIIIDILIGHDLRIRYIVLIELSRPLSTLNMAFNMLLVWHPLLSIISLVDRI